MHKSSTLTTGFLTTLLMFFMSWSISVHAQVVPPKPSVCTTPPAGYAIGGSFLLPETSCSTPQNPNTNVPATNIIDNAGQFNAVSYFYGMADSVDITSASFNPILATFSGTSYKATTLLTPGAHWVMQIGEKNGAKYISCRMTEVIRTDPPVAEIFTCDGSEVRIKIDNVFQNKHNRYKIEWGDSSQDIININATTPLPYNGSHTYTGNLSTVSVTGFYFRNGFEVCKTNPVYKDPLINTAPIINNLKITNGGAGVELKFKDFDAGVKYQIQYAVDHQAGYDWKNLGEAQDGKFSSEGLDKSKSYCFRILTKNECGLEVFSNVICSMKMQADLASSNEVTVSWNLPTSPNGVPNSLQLIRNEQGCATCAKPLSLQSNRDLSYIDKSIECSKIYTYQITTNYTVMINGKSESITVVSDPITVDPKDASTKIVPNGVINVGYPSNDDSMIKLVVYSSDNSTITNYTYYHQGPDDKDFVRIGAGGNSFEDIAIKPSAGSYCYKYQVEDACGITSELSPAFCTVFLSNEGSTLNWTDYTFPENILTNSPAEYVVELYDENIGAFLPQFNTDDLKMGISKLIYDARTPTLKFRVRAQQDIDVPGLTNFTFPSYSNTLVIDVPADVYVPTAFSPNGDGINDYFKVNAKFVEDAVITIFDRWGSILFQGDIAGAGWNGRDFANSNFVPVGTYSYKILGTSSAGSNFSKNGTITVLK